MTRHATQSCAHWLNWKCGIDMGAAREKVRVAHALDQLPKISAAMERGEISYSKVRAITRVACEGTEDYLLMIARHGTAHHVEKMVRGFRRAKDAAEMSREARQQLERKVTFSFDDDGSLILKARLPAEAGALVLKALDLAMKEIPAEQVQESLRDTQVVVDPDTGEEKLRCKSAPSARKADALRLVAENFLQSAAEQANGGDQHQIVVHVSAETLRHSAAGCCEFEDGSFTFRGNGAPIVMRCECHRSDRRRRRRTVERRAQDTNYFFAATPISEGPRQGLRFPGCPNTRHIDAHHVVHWAHGGETKPSNLVSLCSFHHRKVHEGGTQVQVLDDGAIRFVKLDGTAIDGVAPGCTQPFSEWTKFLLFIASAAFI